MMKKTIRLTLTLVGITLVPLVIYIKKPKSIESPISPISILPYQKDREHIEMKYNLIKDHEQAFDLLSGDWHSKNKEDHFECIIDYREIKFRTNGKWKELDGVTVLMGRPQADFYHSGNSYKLAFSVDDNIKSITSLMMIRESPLRSDVLEDMLLEKSE